MIDCRFSAASRTVVQNISLLSRGTAVGEGMSDHELDPKTLDTIFNLIKDAPERQIDNANTLDTKMVQIFGAASVVIGLLGLSRNNFGSEWWITVCLICAVASYLATALIAFS